MKKQTMITLVLLVLLLAIFTFGYFYFQRNTLTPTQPQPNPVTPTGQPEKNQPQSKTYPVSVYFSRHPESDDDPGKVFPLSRTSPDLGVGKFAISELLKGPTEAEKAKGYFTTAVLRGGDSTCGDKDFTLTIKDGVATLTFCRQFDHLGVVADGQADSELKATLLQFNSVHRVIILNSSGNCEFDLSGMDLCKR